MRKVFWLLGLLLTYNALAFGQLESKESLCAKAKKGVLKIKAADMARVAELCDCYEVDEIIFHKVQILGLPDCFAGLDSLRSVSFSRSEVRRLPSALYALSHIESLDLSFTNTYVLPEDLGLIKTLEHLDLRHTFVETLPPGLDHLKSIDMRFIEMDEKGQKVIKSQYPDIDIYLSAPCNCK